MSFNVPWKQAYTGLSKLGPNEVKRLTVEIPMADANTIISVSLSPYILPAICQYALKTTAEHIRKHNLSHADQRAFIDWICNRTFSEFIKETGESDDAGRIAGVRGTTASTSATTPKPGKKVKGGTG